MPNLITNPRMEEAMSKSSRRTLFLALILVAGALSACADAAGPSAEPQGARANNTCTETQGSNTSC